MPAFGWKGQIGLGEESTYGVAVTPTKFLEFRSESLALSEADVIRSLIGRASRSRYNYMRLLGRKSVAGAIELDGFVKGQGILFKAALGSVTSARQGVTTAYLHTFNLANTLPSLTAEIFRDAEVYKYTGLKVASLELTAEQGDEAVLAITVNFIGKDEVIGGTPTTPTYPAANKLWRVFGSTFTIGGVSAPIQRFAVTITNRFDENQYGFSQTRSSLPELDREVTGTIVLPFEAATKGEYTKFVNGQSAALELKLQGALIESTYYEELTITLPCVVYTGETPRIGGPEEIPLNLPFRALYDGTNPEITIKLQNTETSI